MSDWSRDPFFQYPITPVHTSAGEVGLPILYYDDSSMVALFWADAERAQALVEADGLDIVRFAGGRALLALAFYQYRQTAIAAYNEVGSALVVVPKGVRPPSQPLLSLYASLDKRVLGFYILDLPVTTEAACAAGREIWGYPKFITPIAFSLQGDRFEGAVADPQHPGSHLLELSGVGGLGVPGPLLDLVIYSRHRGDLLRTLVVTRGGAKLCLPGSIRLNVSADSAHTMPARLRALGLQGARPFAVMHTHRLQLRLNLGAKIA